MKLFDIRQLTISQVFLLNIRMLPMQSFNMPLQTSVKRKTGPVIKDEVTGPNTSKRTAQFSLDDLWDNPELINTLGVG